MASWAGSSSGSAQPRLFFHRASPSVIGQLGCWRRPWGPTCHGHRSGRTARSCQLRDTPLPGGLPSSVFLKRNRLTPVAELWDLFVRATLFLACRRSCCQTPIIARSSLPHGSNARAANLASALLADPQPPHAVLAGWIRTRRGRDYLIPFPYPVFTAFFFLSDHGEALGIQRPLSHITSAAAAVAHKPGWTVAPAERKSGRTERVSREISRNRGRHYLYV